MKGQSQTNSAGKQPGMEECSAANEGNYPTVLPDSDPADPGAVQYEFGAGNGAQQIAIASWNISVFSILCFFLSHSVTTA
jgi:hypothetical protein